MTLSCEFSLLTLKCSATATAACDDNEAPTAERLVGLSHQQTFGTALVTKWPEWWDWEIELSPHLLKRMIDRGFNETDVRVMLAHALRLREDVEPGRWVVDAKLDSRAWQVIVEPDSLDKLLIVITAFPADRP